MELIIVAMVFSIGVCSPILIMMWIDYWSRK